jgi:hypothetical protein
MGFSHTLTAQPYLAYRAIYRGSDFASASSAHVPVEGGYVGQVGEQIGVAIRWAQASQRLR